MISKGLHCALLRNFIVRTLTSGAILSSTVFGLVAEAETVPVDYEEGVLGDLPETYPLPVLTFAKGTNIVSGTIGRDASIQDDFDSFAFVVPDHLLVISSQVDLKDAESDFLYAWWMLYRGSAIAREGDDLGLTSVDSPGAGYLQAPLSGIEQCFHSLV